MAGMPKVQKERKDLFLHSPERDSSLTPRPHHCGPTADYINPVHSQANC